MYTFDENTISDLHKDARGFRSHTGFWMDWKASSDGEKQVIWDMLCNELMAEIEREEREAIEAENRFNTLVEETIKVGAGNRKTALRWLMDDEKDIPYFMFCNGISRSENIRRELHAL